MKSYELIEFINNCPKEIKKELKNRSFKYGEKLLKHIIVILQELYI